MKGGESPIPARKGVMLMTMYETLMFSLGLAMLVIAILKFRIKK